jgi:hypothetical protein
MSGSILPRTAVLRTLAVLALAVVGPLAGSTTVLCLGPNGHVAIESAGSRCCSKSLDTHEPELGSHDDRWEPVAPGACQAASCTDLPLAQASETAQVAAPPPADRGTPDPLGALSLPRRWVVSRAAGGGNCQRLECVAATCLLI